LLILPESLKGKIFENGYIKVAGSNKKGEKRVSRAVEAKWNVSTEKGKNSKYKCKTVKDKHKILTGMLICKT
jgi:hypothetical protein